MINNILSFNLHLAHCMAICEAGSWVENMLGVYVFIPAEQAGRDYARCSLIPSRHFIAGFWGNQMPHKLTVH